MGPKRTAAAAQPEDTAQPEDAFRTPKKSVPEARVGDFHAVVAVTYSKNPGHLEQRTGVRATIIIKDIDEPLVRARPRARPHHSARLAPHTDLTPLHVLAPYFQVGHAVGKHVTDMINSYNRQNDTGLCAKAVPFKDNQIEVFMTVVTKGDLKQAMHVIGHVTASCASTTYDQDTLPEGASYKAAYELYKHEMATATAVYTYKGLTLQEGTVTGLYTITKKLHDTTFAPGTGMYTSTYYEPGNPGGRGARRARLQLHAHAS